MTLAELKRLNEARTRGPWSVEKPVGKSWTKDSDDNPDILDGKGEKFLPFYYDYEEAGIPRKDADFLVALANSADALIEVCEAAKKVIGLNCKNAKYAHDGCHACQLAKALAKLEAGND